MQGTDRPMPLIEPMSDQPLTFSRDDWDVAWHTQVSSVGVLLLKA